VPDAWIRQWGDPVLHQRAFRVRDVDELLRRQIRRMQERLTEAEGAGLAATQVGILRRLFVYRLTPDTEVEVLVNPRVVAASAERAVFVEGCLSFNTVGVTVVRSVAVRVEGQDDDGRTRVADFEGFAASLMQHEVDHLDGILTLDRADREERWRATSVLLEQARSTEPLAA
jgi:peptide deformylase